MKNVILAITTTALLSSLALNFVFITGRTVYAAKSVTATAHPGKETAYSRADVDYVSQLAGKE